MQHGFKFCLAEAEPLVSVHLARFFKAVLGQIEDRDATAGTQNARAFA